MIVSAAAATAVANPANVKTPIAYKYYNRTNFPTAYSMESIIHLYTFL